MNWWNCSHPPLAAQDAQWVQLRRAIDRAAPGRPGAADQHPVRTEKPRRARPLLRNSLRLLAASRRLFGRPT
jgi:hypothetical protein